MMIVKNNKDCLKAVKKAKKGDVIFFNEETLKNMKIHRNFDNALANELDKLTLI